MSSDAAKTKKKKEPWEIVIKDRFLKEDKPDNPYVTAFLYFVVFFLSFLLILVCFFQLCEVKGNSMLTTLESGDHVLLLRSSSTYERGDIVVITKDRNGSDYNIIKRIIAVEGDELLFELTDPESNESEVTVKLKKKNHDEFVLLGESYIREPMKRNKGFKGNFTFGEPIEIPSGHIFVMGDNRNQSEDSRGEDGAYPVVSVYGKSFMKVSKGSLLEKLLKIVYNANRAND